MGKASGVPDPLAAVVAAACWCPSGPILSLWARSRAGMCVRMDHEVWTDAPCGPYLAQPSEESCASVGCGWLGPREGRGWTFGIVRQRYVRARRGSGRPVVIDARCRLSMHRSGRVRMCPREGPVHEFSGLTLGSCAVGGWGLAVGEGGPLRPLCRLCTFASRWLWAGLWCSRVCTGIAPDGWR